MAPKLILTGFMAAGKSVVARALAVRLGWRLIDLDAELEARAAKPIREIFSESGEAHFRAMERDIIAEVASEPSRCPQCGEARPAVVATGGGAIVDAQNFDALSKIGVIICLTARPEIIARRVGRKASLRPMLTRGGKPLPERIAELMAERREAYSRAPVTIDTSDLSVDQVVDSILTAVTAYRKSQWAAFA